VASQKMMAGDFAASKSTVCSLLCTGHHQGFQQVLGNPTLAFFVIN